MSKEIKCIHKVGDKVFLFETYEQPLRTQIEQLQNQLAITEKALELACETLQDINFKLYNTEMNFVDFFKQQAKEMLENE